MNSILEADRRLFILINEKWTVPAFDTIMPFLRNANLWLPFYVFLIAFALLNVRNSGWFILFALITIGITDQVSSKLIKEWVGRPRPCQDQDLLETLRLVAGYCPGNKSFTSSHAANHFGLATYLSLTLTSYVGRWVYLSFLWAFLIVYAQVYVGIHYPLDVLGGAVIGILAGVLTAGIYNKRWGNLNLNG